MDHQTTEDFSDNDRDELHRLHEQLRTDTYRPAAVRRTWIPKPGSSTVRLVKEFFPAERIFMDNKPRQHQSNWASRGTRGGTKVGTAQEGGAQVSPGNLQASIANSLRGKPQAVEMRGF